MICPSRGARAAHAGWPEWGMMRLRRRAVALPLVKRQRARFLPDARRAASSESIVPAFRTASDRRSLARHGFRFDNRASCPSMENHIFHHGEHGGHGEKRGSAVRFQAQDFRRVRRARRGETAFFQIGIRRRLPPAATDRRTIRSRNPHTTPPLAGRRLPAPAGCGRQSLPIRIA